MVPVHTPRRLSFPLVLALTLVSPSLAGDRQDCSSWVRDSDVGSWGRYCEIRELSLPVASPMTVDAGPDGGVSIEEV